MEKDGRPFSEFAFLYAVPLDSVFIKSLLLFFDGVAIVAASNRVAQAVSTEPEFFLPFLQSGLGKVWNPEDFFDIEFRETYATEIRSLLSCGWFDNRPRNLIMDRYLFPDQMAFPPPDWGALQTKDEVARFRDRLIGPGSSSMNSDTASKTLLNELELRGLLEVRQYIPMAGFRPGDPGLVGIPPTSPSILAASMPNVSNVPGMPNLSGALPGMFSSNIGNPHVLALDATFSRINDALVSQFARSRAGHRFGLALAPVNASEMSLTQLLEAWRDTERQVTVGRVILQDLEVVGHAIENVPFDDIMRFRENHGEAHREYMREPSSFVRDMSQLSLETRENELFDRRQKLRVRL